MFKRLKIVLTSLLSIFVIGTGAGFAAWVYDSYDVSKVNSSSEVDDIKENYNFGKPSPLMEFEMYFFPSTYYMYVYQEHLKNPTANPLPEQKYGYIDRDLNSDNTVNDRIVKGANFNATNTADNLNNYAVHIEDLETSRAGSTYVSTAVKAKEKLADGLQYSSTKIDKEEVAGASTTKPQFQSYEKEVPFFQKLNQEDRLGYWYHKEVNEGRYLPVRLSFRGSLSPDYYKHLIEEPFTDMGDKEGWHNFKFANWTFYNKNMTNPDYVDPSQGFDIKDYRHLFDILGSLKNYGELSIDKTTCTIRLFPIFSNGKRYDAVPDISILQGNGKYNEKQHGYVNGFRDGIRLDYLKEQTTSNGSKYFDIISRYFTFPAGEQAKTFSTLTADFPNYPGAVAQHEELHDGVFTMEHPLYSYAVLNNYEFQPNIDIKIRGTKIYPNHVLSGFRDRLVTQAFWEPNEWREFATLDLNKTFMKGGIYNIYIFTTQNTFADKLTADKAMSWLSADVITATNSEFINLRGRYLNKLDIELDPLNNITNSRTFYNNTTTWFDNAPNHNDSRSYTIFYELVADLKIIKDIPIDEKNGQIGNIGENAIYKDSGYNATSNHVHKVFGESRSYFISQHKFYKGKVDSSCTTFTKVRNPNEGTGSYNDISLLNRGSPYVYKIESVDFLHTKTNFFEISVGEDYSIKKASFRIDSVESSLPGDGMTVSKDEYAALYESDDYLTNSSPLEIKPDQSNVYYDANKFFDIVGIADVDQNGVPIKDADGVVRPDRMAFKVKEGSKYTFAGKGYYNFVIYFNRIIDSTGNLTNRYTLDFFVYRQKNVFTKIFASQPKMGADNLFINHTDGTTYYKYRYYIGDDIIPNGMNANRYVKYVNNKPTNEELTFDEIFTLFIEQKYKDKTTNKVPDGIYYMLDHVSTRVVAAVKYVNGAQVNLSHSKNLQILKNYIFFVCNDAEYHKTAVNPIDFEMVK